MSYRISLDEIDGCLNVTDGERTVKVERFATDGIREVYGHTVELLDRENAKLREERNHWKVEQTHAYGNWEDAHKRVVELEVANAKLRELVRDMWQFTGAACKKYPRLFDPAAQGGQMVQLNAIDAFEQRMAELGIEVPE